MRRSRARRRGIQRGVQRHRISSNLSISDDGDPSDEDLDEASKFYKLKILEKIIKILPQLANACSNAFSSACFNLCLVRLVKDSDGRLHPAPLWRRIVFYVIYSLIGLSMIHKLCVIAQLAATSTAFSVRLYFCFFCFWSQVVSLCVGLGVTMLPQETMEVANTWPRILSHFECSSGGSVPLSPLRKVSVSLQIIITSMGTLLGIVVIPLFSLYFTSVPVYTMNAFVEAGLIQPDELLPAWAWRLVFLPAEFLQYSIPLVPYGMGAILIVMQLGVFKVINGRMRRMRAENVESWEHLKNLYLAAEVHGKQCCDWFRPILFPILVSVGGATVMLLYFPIKYHNLSPAVTAAFVGMAMTLMGILFWVCFDTVVVTRSSEEVIGQLTTSPSEFGRHDGESVIQARAFLKRAKALRPVNFSIGSFGEFSLDVPVIMWEEILNELLFLLSL